MDFSADDTFPEEDVDTIVKNAISSMLGGKKDAGGGGDEAMYNHRTVNGQINSIVDSCLKELQSLNRPFKYIVSCVIMQKNGAGLESAASLFWDPMKDGRVTVPWENATMHVIVTVYGLALNLDNAAELD
jgi:dynein light chain Tctex-type 1